MNANIITIQTPYGELSREVSAEFFLKTEEEVGALILDMEWQINPKNPANKKLPF